MSNAFQIDSLSDDTLRQLEREAASRGISLADWAAQVLTSHCAAAATPTTSKVDKSTALRRLFGTWDEQQLREFDEAVADFERIDESMWK
jgi:hypothetical protein